MDSKYEEGENAKTPLSPQPSFPIAWRKREQNKYKIPICLKGKFSLWRVLKTFKVQFSRGRNRDEPSA